MRPFKDPTLFRERRILLLAYARTGTPGFLSPTAPPLREGVRIEVRIALRGDACLPHLGQEDGMRFLGRLLKAIFAGGKKDSFLPETAEEKLRVKIHYWQHQACLYDLAGMPVLARRCRAIAQQYRAKIVASVFRNEAA